MKQLLRIMSAALGIAGLVCLGLFIFKGSGAGKLTWDGPITRKSLMTFAYKIYGNPAAQNGRYFLSKIVFHNDGTGPVRNLSVSYQIPGYISWTTPETQAEILPGQTVVQLYYPQLSSTQFTSQTTTTLETRIRWEDKPGKTNEDVLRSNVELRGFNELEYTDLPANEILTWYDVWATSPFAAAMVTPNDPVVKEFVAEITKRMGGTTAGILGGPQEVVRLMKAVYDYMCETGMHYAGDQGVPATMGDIRTAVQTVRFPRDVIITNEGLCIELALLWASVMEHLGCKTTVVFRPGHAFTVVHYGQGESDIIPIECTAITPMAVGRKQPVSFEDAVKMAQEDLQTQKYKMFVNIQQYQNEGFRAPELPNIDVNEIKNILAERTKHTAAAYAQTAGANAAAQPAAATGETRPGYYRWIGANNMVSVDVPENWTHMENSPVPGMVFAAQDMQTSVGVNVFDFPSLSTADQAMQAVRQGIERVLKTKVKIATQQQKGNSIIYTGTTSSSLSRSIISRGSTSVFPGTGLAASASSIAGSGSTQWVGVFGPAQRGIIGLFVGTAKGYFEKNQPIIQDIISSARLGTSGDGDSGADKDQNE
jgi:hypothetical protein